MAAYTPVPLTTHFTHFATLGSVVGGMGSSVGRLLCDYVLKKGARAIRIGDETLRRRYETLRLFGV